MQNEHSEWQLTGESTLEEDTLQADTLQEPLAEYDPFGETAPAQGFLALSEEGLLAFGEAHLTGMHLADMRFCQAYYRREGRTPTYGELRMLEALIEERRRSAEGYVMSRIRIADDTVAATYEDMVAKCRVLFPNRNTPLTVADMAMVSGAYMNRIGRGGEAFSRKEEQTPALPTGTAFVLLMPAEENGAYEQGLADMLTNPEIAPLYGGKHRVNRYGILGTLALLGNGVFADLRLLSQTDTEPIRLSDLVTEHHGRMMLSATRENAAWLCRYAERYGLRATYFAKLTETGRWRTSREASVAVDVDISFLCSLLHGMDLGELALPQEDFGAPYTHTRLMGGVRAPMSARRAVALLATAEENCFSAAVGLMLDATLHLVCRGVDRRSVGFSLSYGLPRYANGETEMGKNLSLILGAYRVTVELAAPEFESAVEYIGGGRRLACTAYTPSVGKNIPDRVTRAGSRVGYLTFRRNEAGVPDFEDFRQTCDRFIAWCERGIVLSARAVTGDAPSAASELASEGLCVEWKADTDFRLSGILFEYDGKCSLEGALEVGRTVAVSSGENGTV